MYGEETPVYVSDTMDERTEVKLLSMFGQIRDADPEAFDKAGMQMLLAREDYLREVLPPHAPAIVMLDSYHRGFDL